MTNTDARTEWLRRALRIPDRPVERDIDEELAFHLESRMSALRDTGLSEAEARQRAIGEYGDIDASRRELAAVDRQHRRRKDVLSWLDGIGLDLRHAARALVRSPGFSLAAFGTLAVGATALVTMFSIVDGVLLRPLPYKNPERLVGAWHDMLPVNLYHEPQSITTYFTYRTQANTIESIGVYRETSANVAPTDRVTDPKHLTIAKCSASLFAVLGTRALVGRALTDEDDRTGAAPVAVISERTWRAEFGANPTIVGRQVDVDGVTRQIVGVMPASFAFPSARTALWIPLNVTPIDPPADAFSYIGIARLKAGVTREAAERDFATVLPRVSALYPKFVPGITTKEIMDQTRPRPILTSLRDDVTGGIARTLWMIAGAAALLFLVACVNVGNLSLVRFAARQRELAVRQALGASVPRLARYYVAEIALVALAACVVSIVAAQGIVRVLVARSSADIPRLSDVAIDGASVLFALAVTAFAVVAAVVVPVMRMRRPALLRIPTARGGTASHGEARLRSALVAAQIALALVVLAGSGLLVRSFERLRSVRLGFRPDGVATMWVSLPATRYPSDSEVVRFYSRLVDAAKALPGVTDAGVSTMLPLVARGVNENPLFPEGAANFDTKLPPLQLFSTVGGNYFQALRIPLLAGKFFDEFGVQRDGDAIVSRRAAEMFWNDSTGRSAVGKRFRRLPAGPFYTVIGVVGDVHDTSLVRPSSPAVYFPEAAARDSSMPPAKQTMALAVRTQGDPASLTPGLLAIVRDIDPRLPAFDMQSLPTAVGVATARLRFTIAVLGGAAIVTLLLGAIGLYGVIAYVVSLRRREIGIRIALGATPRAVFAATTGEAISLAGVGVIAGIVLFILAARFVRTLLFGVAAWDPLTIAGASLVLLATALLASWVPARRAADIDPAETLRAE